MSKYHAVSSGMVTRQALPSITRQRGTTTGSANLMLYGAGKTTVSNNTTFIDSSANAFTVTRNGDTVQSGFNPFSQASSGSGYFDGTGDYLTVPYNTAFDFGSGDFTIESFVYLTATPINYKSIIGRWGGVGNTASWQMFFFSNTTRPGFQLNYTGTPGVVSSPTALALNAWHHLALVRNGTTVTLYANGTSVATSTGVGTLVTPVGNVAIGTNLDDITNQSFPGYISNARVVKGTAVYTSNFTPPTSPLTAISGTSLLLLTDNYSIVNSTATNLPVTINGNTTISTAQFPTGMSSSIYFDGTGDYVTVTGGTTALAFGTGDFTIEFFVYLNSTQTSIMYDGRPISINGTQPTIYILNNGVRYYTTTDRIIGSTISNNTWTHIALTRSGTSTKLFLNGTQTGSTYTDNTNYTNTSDRPVVGVDGSTANSAFVNGYISNMRVCKGTALYTANFTPPSLPMSTTVTFPNFVTNNIYGLNQIP